MFKKIYSTLAVFMTLELTYTLSLPSQCMFRKCLAIDCPNGYTVDENGCQTCECRPSCPVVDCLPGTVCPYGFIQDSNGCQTCKCKQPDCPVCPLRDCPHGYEMGVNNCRTCDCKPPVCPKLPICKSCPAGYEVDANGCSTCNCKCSQVACRCLYGTLWLVDQNGCRQCTCKARQVERPVDHLISLF